MTTNRLADRRGQRAANAAAYWNARISVDYISTRVVFSNAEYQGTSDDPEKLDNSLYGLYFTSWTRYSPINTIWDQLELVNYRENIDITADIPKRS